MKEETDALPLLQAPRQPRRRQSHDRRRHLDPRRRQCPDCVAAFHHRGDALADGGQAQSGVTEPFSRDKVIAGVRKACQGRPVTEDALAQLGQRVEEAVRATGSAELSTHDVGLAILGPLQELDLVAYLRFASVYRAFDSLEDFEAAIAELAEAAGGARREPRRTTTHRGRTPPHSGPRARTGLLKSPCPAAPPTDRQAGPRAPVDGRRAHDLQRQRLPRRRAP